MIISIVIPTYNEEKRITETLQRVAEYLNGRGYNYELIVSDDGSTDKTCSLVEEFINRDHPVKLIKNRHRGKGAAVREGISASKGELVLVSDADLSTPIEKFHKLYKAIKIYDIVIASRDLPQSKILKHQPWYREVLGKLFNKIVQLFFLPGIHDTQCGFKLFKREVALSLFKDLTVKSFLFDVEVLYLAKKRGYRIAEVPVTWSHSEPSRVSVLRELPQVITDFLKIKFINR